METACIHCGAEHTLKETELGGHSKVQFRCSKCGKSTVVRVKYHANATVLMSPLPSFARAAPGGLSLQSQPEDPSLKLPAAQTILASRPGHRSDHRHEAASVLGRKADIAVEI
jgi:predicted RNA-binding Zn-ribbon protein involved in translation (DUF1610 family)